MLAFYGKLVIEHSKEWLKFSKYLLADAYFSKKPFVDQTIQAGMHLISRLRDDADLKYIYKGAKKTGKGKPKLYDGKIDKQSPDPKHFILEEENPDYKVFSAVVYCKAFKRKIQLALVVFLKDGNEMTRKMYFSTDLSMTAMQVLTYCRSRFQIEFIYRDAKQYTGLNHCQGRSKQKLDFHWNAALTTINLAKILHQCDENHDKGNFSMANFKTLCHNILLLERFTDVFGINPNSTLNQKKIRELLYFGNIAA